jgi:hypothetical protein
MEQTGKITGVSATDQIKANVAVFEELHKWSEKNLAMGVGADVSEKQIRVGLKAVKRKFKNDPKAAQAYGLDPLTVLTVLSALFNILGWLVRWWKGEV